MSEEEKKKAYWGLFITNCLIALGFGIADPFLPVYAVSKGATGFHIALIFSGYAVAKTLMSPLIGWWSDRSGRRCLIIIGLCIYLAVSLSYLSMPGPVALIAVRLVQGVGAALVRPIVIAFIGDIAPVRKEAETMGTFDISFYGAVAVGPVIGGFIKDVAGFSGVFASLALLCLLSVISTLVLVTISPNYALKGVEPAPADLSDLRTSRVLVGLSGFIFTRSFGITLFAVFGPIFMHDTVRLKGLEMGIIMGAGTVVTTSLLRPMGRISDKIQRHWLVILGGSLAAVLTFCLPMARSFTHLLLVSIGIGVFSVVSLPASSALLVQEGNLYGMGLTMGIFNSAMNLGAGLAPLAGGLVLGFFGLDAIFYGAGFLGFMGIVFFCLCAWPIVRPGKAGRRMPACT